MEAIIQFLPFIFFGVAIYFFMVRPQKKQADQKRAMLEAMTKGDVVVTIGGLHAVVEEVNTTDNTVVLDCEGIYLTYDLHAIRTVKRTATTTPEVGAEPEVSAE